MEFDIIIRENCICRARSEKGGGIMATKTPVNQNVKMKKSGLLNLSRVSILHYIKLLYRSALFIATLVIYIVNKVNGYGIFNLTKDNYQQVLSNPLVYIVPGIIWIVYVLEMVLRFVPSKLESPGCQKIFAQNYRPTGARVPMLQPIGKTLLVALVWCAINAPFVILYVLDKLGVFPLVDDGVMILLSLAYGVCDMICILFFCPFQSWIMKNRCCSTCRIYNWDFIMMFTPMIFLVFSPFMPFAISLVAISIALFIVWEINVTRHTERFSDKTNKSIQCRYCNEKLCHHKKQLKSFIKRNGAKLDSYLKQVDLHSDEDNDGL